MRCQMCMYIIIKGNNICSPETFFLFATKNQKLHQQRTGSYIATIID